MSKDKNSLKEEEKEIPIGTLKGFKVVIDSENIEEVTDEGMFGTLEKNEVLILDPFESSLLLERGKIKVRKTGKERKLMKVPELLEYYISEIPLFWEKYLVYIDLKNRGYPVKAGPGKLVDFRVYPRGSRPMKEYAKFFIHIVTEGKPTSIIDLRKSIDYSKQNKRKIILAIGDRSGNITYYQVSSLNLSKI
ncbi:MAG: tRNA-intron lyase [Candidatus Ranarchaeia archaeon]